MASIFTKIIEREIPAYIVAEDDTFIAFLDNSPNAAGHTLCVPKEESDKIFEMGEHPYLQLMQFSRKIAIALKKVVPCQRVGMAVVGLEVPHVHVHLIPLNQMSEMDFKNKITMSPAEFEALASKIREQLL